MTSDENTQNGLADLCKNLAEYAVDREDIKALVQSLPTGQNINTVTLDYELQLLKIISVGWGLAVYMENHPQKLAAAELFWNMIRDFSKEISTVTELMIGHNVDYFNLLKERFDYYVSSLTTSARNDDPASAIGPAFAESCKDKDNPFVTITGARIFMYSTRAVKEYLDSLNVARQ